MSNNSKEFGTFLKKAQKLILVLESQVGTTILDIWNCQNDLNLKICHLDFIKPLNMRQNTSTSDMNPLLHFSAYLWEFLTGYQMILQFSPEQMF